MYIFLITQIVQCLEGGRHESLVHFLLCALDLQAGCQNGQHTPNVSGAQPALTGLKLLVKILQNFDWLQLGALHTIVLINFDILCTWFDHTLSLSRVSW